MAGLEIAFLIAQPISGRLLFGMRLAGLDPQAGGLLLIPVALAISGSALGAGQWLILRRYLSNVGWWPIACTAGALVAAPFSVGIAWHYHHLLTPNEALVYAVLTGCVTGFCLAFAQLRILRVSVRASTLWLVAGIVGYGLGAVLAMTTSIFQFLPYELTNVVLGGVAGSTTGAALVRVIASKTPSRISGLPANPPLA
jgi:hypothetical protein